MKDDNNHREEAHPIRSAARCRFSLAAAVIICLCIPTVKAWGQSCEWSNIPFHNGERISYDVYFKWGLIMSKAGHAVFSTGETPWEGEEAWRYHMQFNSLGMAETFYKMRDTLSTLLSPQGRPISSSKHTDEGGFYMVDELIFSNEQPFDIRSTRRARGRTRIDTVLTAGGCVYDMLGAVMYARSIDFDNLRPGAEFPFKVAVGKDIVNVRFRYTGPSTAKQGDASYGAHHFYIDVYDAAFAQSKEAAEVWIGNDDNHIPVRVRAKLKIGAAEVHYKESSGLRHPLSCRLAGK